MIRLSRLLLVAGFVLGLGRLAAADSMKMDMKNEILSSYTKVASALAADDLAAAKTAAKEVAEHATMSDKNKAIAAKANAVAKAAKIEEARDAFKALSDAVVPLAAGDKKYTVMNCPMAGDWVQVGKDVKNPYMGKAMLTCGGPKESK